jgi:hypothetical protein
MVDMGSIAAALGGLKTAGEIAKALLQMKSESDRQAKVIELQSVILAAQSSAIAAQSDQFTMLEEVRKAKVELANVKAWETEKQRYQLVVPYSGCTVYALKESMSAGEAPHYLCANCFQDGKRSFLQHIQPKGNFVHLTCAACRAQMDTRYNGIGPAVYAEKVRTDS